MLLPDVNVLVYAHRRDSIRNHAEYADWIYGLATGPEPFALSVLVLSGLVRVVTNARIFTPPSALDEVFGFIAELAHRPTARILERAGSESTGTLVNIGPGFGQVGPDVELRWPASGQRSRSAPRDRDCR